MLKSNYEVQVLVNGNPVREYEKDGKIYIEGKEGTEFSLKIKNNGYKRIVAIPTVDGLSIIDGRPASFNSPGYIISGYNCETIDGWRKTQNEVAKFYFSEPGKSYAKETGKDGNLGVIGVVIFREKDHCFTYTYDFITLDSSGTFPLSDTTATKYEPHSFVSNTTDNCCYNLSASNQEIGTGWGTIKESKITEVSFEKENTADAIFEIYYNTRKQLEKMGINFKEKPSYISPRAFPGESKYCEPPKN